MRGWQKSLTLAYTALAALSLVIGCSSSADNEDTLTGLGAKGGGSGAAAATGGSGGSSAGGGIAVGGTGSGATGSGATGGVIIDPGTGMSGMGQGAMPGNGTPEVCDGIDNDGNGIVNDVNAGGDGVCDCLSIGTIGQIGPWSNGGNIFKTWLDARTPKGAVALDDQVLTPDLLAPLQVIVVLHVDDTEVSNDSVVAHAHHDFSDDEATAFGDWVKNGGGTMTTIGYTGDEGHEVLNVNRLLAPVGMAYSTTKLDLSGFIQDWTAHPVTNGVSNIKTDNGVEPDGPSGTTLAHDMSGRIALQVNEPGSGHVIVWGDEWITYDSEWANVTDEQVELFWLNMLKWLSPPKICQVPIPPGLVK